MSVDQNQIQKFEKCLDDFYSAVNWNEAAENNVQKLLDSSTCNKYCTKNNDEENPYTDEPLLPSANFPPAVAPHPSVCCQIDAVTQKGILKRFWKSDAEDIRQPPSCLAEEWLHFSIEERKALHQYTLLHTRAPATPPDLILQNTDLEGESESTIDLQRRARDLKRRRQAYRTAATGGKTLTEVTREVIGNIMELIGAGREDKDDQLEARSHPPSGYEKNKRITRLEEGWKNKERGKHRCDDDSRRRERHEDRRRSERSDNEDRRRSERSDNEDRRRGSYEGKIKSKNYRHSDDKRNRTHTDSDDQYYKDCYTSHDKRRKHAKKDKKKEKY